MKSTVEIIESDGVNKISYSIGTTYDNGSVSVMSAMIESAVMEEFRASHGLDSTPLKMIKNSHWLRGRSNVIDMRSCSIKTIKRTADRIAKIIEADGVWEN